MSDVAIRVDNLSKLYRIGVEERRPQGLTQVARSLLSSPFAYLQRMMRPPSQEETLWALKDVSFEAGHFGRAQCRPEQRRRVQRGEVVGIPSTGLTQSRRRLRPGRTGIGRNGAGKRERC